MRRMQGDGKNDRALRELMDCLLERFVKQREKFKLRPKFDPVQNFLFDLP